MAPLREGSSAGSAGDPLPVIYSPAIEGFVRAYRERLTPEVVREIAALGMNFDALAPAYPLEIFERAMRRTGEILYPELALSARFRRIGYEFVGGYVQTTLGRAVLIVARAFAPERMFQRMSRIFRGGSNYLGSETTLLGPGHVELRTWMLSDFVEGWRGRPTLQLDYRLGILEGAAEMIGIRDAVVTVLEKSAEDQSVRYRIRWSP